MIRKASLLVSAALILVSACGNRDEGPGPVDGITTARDQMQPLVNAACDWMFGCCTSGELVYQLGGFTVDADDCSERLIEAISAGVPLELEQEGLSNDPAEGLLVLARSINEERVDVDPEAVSECAEATRTRDCNIPVQSAEGPVGRCIASAVAQDEADPCDPVIMFKGKQDVGDECDGPWECQEGLRCVDTGIIGICAPQSDDGESCFSDDECGSGLVCNFESGQCEAGALSGQSCQYADPLNPIPGTEVIRCADGLTCDPINVVCVGGSCAPGSPCEDTESDTDCPQGFFCVGNFATLATCQQPGQLGAPCSKVADCMTGYCDRNNPMEWVCGELKLAGEPCGVDGGAGHSECQSGFCFDQLCAASFGNGMPCASTLNQECKEGFCDATTDPTAPTCLAFIGPGGLCTGAGQCDAASDLECWEGECLTRPFPNGTYCTDSGQCESRACFMSECTTGAVEGLPCRTDGSTEPCIVGTFCETAGEEVNGICTVLRGSGEPCSAADQCWGECIVRFGQLMCDSTPPVEKIWCDGP